MSVYAESVTSGAILTGTPVGTYSLTLVAQAILNSTLTGTTTYLPGMSETAKGLAAFLTTFGFTHTDGATLGTATSIHWAAGALVAEVIKARDTYHTGLVFSTSIAEMAKIGDTLQALLVMAIAEGATVTDLLNSVASVLMLQRAVARGVPGSTAAFGMLAHEAVGALDAYLALANINVGEGATLSAAIIQHFIGSVQVVQNLAIHGETSASLLLNPIMLEDCTLTDTELLTTIFQGDPILETAYATVSYCSPDSNSTTWVMNTRTNVVTEYVNWVFNSFASFGRKYIGANGQGIWELNGERDGTTNIVADMAGGYIQFNGSRLNGLMGVYIGMRGQGEFYLKLSAGDGRDYLYQFNSQPGLMTTKVNIGKGLRSRYFQWELISTGPDFDLDSIEFVPMVGKRRV
jgi:hypothetical protein